MDLVTTPLPNVAEQRANATFAALMGALARPGTVQVMPEPGPEGIAEALIDGECRVHSDLLSLQRFVLTTGARLVEAAEADHVFLSATDLAIVAQVPVGSPLYPDQGATVVLPARLGEGQRLRLSGPGMAEPMELRIGGLPEGLWPLRQARSTYPAGFELFLTEGTKVIGLPRSTRIEVL